MSRILVAEDEPNLRSFLVEVLQNAGHEVIAARAGDEASGLLSSQGFDVLLTDLRMPGLGGMELLAHVRAQQPDLETIILTAHGTVETAVEAMKRGAFDYLQKPLSGPAELALVVERALEHRRLMRLAEQAAPVGETPLTFGDPAMGQVVAGLQRVARTGTTLLLTGESGTGKEVCARQVHAWSPRANGPFVAVNCAALTDGLLESELFGHERGAFTGAVAQRRGKLELAEGGTFFLDEIGELKPELQAKLLRVLQEKQFERIGGTRTLRVDARWIAATNADLPSLVSDGLFREDLYHRLNVFPVRLPPLRERRSDIVPLARRLLGSVAAELGRPGMSLTPEAEALIAEAAWTGNVRELRNALERATILAEDRELGASAFSFPAPGGQPQARTMDLQALERRAIVRALEDAGGNRRRAAEKLGIGVRTLYEKLNRYGLREPR